MLDLSELMKQLETCEKAVGELRNRVEGMQKEADGAGNAAEGSDSEAKIRNTKLKHRLTVLKNALEDERKRHKKPKLEDNECGDFIPETCGVQQAVKIHVLGALKAAFPDVKDYGQVIAPSTRPIFGDFQCSAPMSMLKQLKELGSPMPPFEIAKKIHSCLAPTDMFEKAEVAKPGFINFWLSQKFLEEKMREILTKGVSKPVLRRKKRVLIDFSSPNIAKEMHVGHLRSTIIGDCLSKLLESLGYDVLRINHIGDWGTQFGMLIAHLSDVCPHGLENAPPLSDLQAFYKAAKVRFDADEGFKRRALDAVVALQSGQPDHVAAWRNICAASRAEFQKIYDRLGVKGLVERGESFYNDGMVKLVKELEERGVLVEEEGRKLYFAKEEGILPMTIVKSDGGFTYDTSDLAALKYRIFEDKAEWIIVVTDAGQALHFKALYNAGAELGFLDGGIRCDHVPLGVVLGPDGKRLRTRAGDTIRLAELLDEGVRRAEAALESRGRHEALTKEELEQARDAVAYGCIRYADFSHGRGHDYVFSFDKMLDDRGDTAVYLLYALTRIRAILRGAGVSNEDLLTHVAKLELEHAREQKLAKALLGAPTALLAAARDLSPHYLCQYLYSVATTFSEFYDVCYCVEKDQSGTIVKVNHSRLLLCQATARMMETFFDILGIKTVAKM